MTGLRQSRDKKMERTEEEITMEEEKERKSGWRDTVCINKWKQRKFRHETKHH